MSEAQPAKSVAVTLTVAVTYSYQIQLKKVSFACMPVTLSAGSAQHQCASTVTKLA